MSTPEPLTRRHVSFAIAGLVFGAVLGFTAAHQIYVGRRAQLPVAQNAPSEAGPAMGMRGSAGPDPAAAGMPAAGGGPMAGGAPDMAVMEQVRKEIGDLKKTLEEHPKDLEALRKLGNLYMDAGMFDRAAEYYQDALAVDGTLVDVRTDMGTCLRRLGRPQEALDAFQTSVRQDPNHWKGWFNIGVVCLYDLQRYDEAEKAFEQVLALNPGSFDMNAVREEIRRIKSAPQQDLPGSQGSPS